MILPSLWCLVLVATSCLLMPSEMVGFRPRRPRLLAGMLGLNALFVLALLSGAFGPEAGKFVPELLQPLSMLSIPFWCVLPFVATGAWLIADLLKGKKVTHAGAVGATGVLGLFALALFIWAESMPRGGLYPGLDRIGQDLGAVACSALAAVIVVARACYAWLAR